MEKIFRRQFVMGNIREKGLLKDFNKERLGGFNIFAHKDLGLTRIDKDEKSLILLGFIIDPYHYQRTDREILKDTIESINNFDDLLKKSLSFGGRWILVYKSRDEFKLVSDPSGLRQVHYSENHPLIGSNPAIINYIEDHSEREDENYKKYISSKFYKINEMEWYTNQTPYKNIKKLLPNSYLDLDIKKICDFYLDIEEKSYCENIKIVTELLVKSLKGISQRQGEKIQSLTAGYDSRVIFAASEASGCDFDFFLSTMNVISRDNADIKIAEKILSDYGKDLEIIDDLADISPDFKETYQKSIAKAKILPKTLTIHHFYKKGGDYIHISGNNSAVFKDYYKEKNPRDGKDLARIVGIPASLVIFNDDFEKWLKKRKNLAKNKGIDLMKLFYWEHRMPNWGSQYQQEADLAMEEFAPFNNRETILRLISMSRDKSYTQVFDDIIKSLDPNLLSYEINPRTKKERAMDMVKNHVSKRNWERIKTILK
ncbi:hypothetical protein [uncultured Anaerococcus sp.]|uniref:hypothetical protein n=1 Tax=uncultured Anaerococcus sp. TaxID=293428 RepID=UPI0025DF0B0E|nr:hypothetical protein [uncultured Anaerococcus sp.]